jgi:Ca2+-binding EF-hand superfamily protein
MSRIGLSVLAAAAALAGLVAGPPDSRAQAVPSAAAPRQPLAARVLDHLFDRVDSDHDGMISKAEFDAERDRRFATADRDGDGRVTRAEFRAGGAALRREWRQGDGTSALALRDLDGDGAVSKAEYLAPSITSFERLDKNGDGKLDGAEMAAERPAQRPRGAVPRKSAPERSTAAAPNDTAAPARRPRTTSWWGWHPLRWFGGADSDRDGALARAEFATAADALFTALDGDHDGRISRAEAERLLADHEPSQHAKR